MGKKEKDDDLDNSDEEENEKSDKGEDDEDKSDAEGGDDDLDFDSTGIPTISAMAEEPQKLRKILAKFTPEQQRRYEYFRKSNFQRASIKRLMQSVTTSSITPTMVIVMSGITKVFVGEIVENSKTIMDEWGEVGPVRPRHMREAYRRLRLSGKVPYHPRQRKRLFRR